MRLLVTTQTIDRNDPVLGFFHEWLAALSPQFTSMEAICLKEGEHTLPKNIHVHSLGKERGGSRSSYALQFLSLITKHQGSYDAVLVHMNPEYILLGGLFWKLTGKKIYLWYNHPQGGLRLSLAMLLSDKVFHTSPHAASAHSKKSVRMPAGIDVHLFSPQKVTREANAIYMQCRIMPSKRIELACEALRILRERCILVTLTVVGPADAAYKKQLEEEYDELLREHTLTLRDGVPNRETPALFSAHAVSLNLAASGHYDKSVLESMACETPVITAGTAFSGLIPKEWIEADVPIRLADALEEFFGLTLPEREALGRREREAVVKQESLDALVDALSRTIGKSAKADRA